MQEGNAVYPEGEQEYEVGLSGFVHTAPDGSTRRYPPHSFVWLTNMPAGTDLRPTGRRRRYETKIEESQESKERVVEHGRRRRFQSGDYRPDFSRGDVLTNQEPEERPG